MAAAEREKTRRKAKKETALEREIRPGMQVEFICPKCGTHLAWALPESRMVCPQCGVWVTGKNRKQKEDDVMLPVNDDQLTLF
ncbi:MAG TPA: hypothetical protein DCY37_06210 [Acidaminococcaceae bacterium]|nr:hypothetical protein [Acidaminococcaceae bacterium]